MNDDTTIKRESYANLVDAIDRLLHMRMLQRINGSLRGVVGLAPVSLDSLEITVRDTIDEFKWHNPEVYEYVVRTKRDGDDGMGGEISVGVYYGEDIDPRTHKFKIGWDAQGKIGVLHSESTNNEIAGQKFIDEVMSIAGGGEHK